MLLLILMLILMLMMKIKQVDGRLIWDQRQRQCGLQTDNGRSHSMDHNDPHCDHHYDRLWWWRWLGLWSAMLLIWLEVIMPWNILWFCDWKLMILDFLCTAAAALWSFSEENNFLPRHLLLDTHQHRYHGNSFLFNQILYIFLSFFGMLHPHIHTSSYKSKDSHHVVRHAVLAAASEAVELLRVPSQGRRLSTPVQSWVPPAIDDVSKMHFCPWHAPNNVNQSYEHNIRGSMGRRGGG